MTEIDRALADELGRIAEHGPTLVTIRPKTAAAQFVTTPYELVRALRRAGFWPDENTGIWRGMVGVRHHEIGGLTA